MSLSAPSYGQILLILLPIFLLIGAGVLAQRVRIISGDAETGLIRLVVLLLYPCFVFDSVSGASDVTNARSLFVPAILGFLLTSFGVLGGFFTAKAAGFTPTLHQRTFALAVGINNYSYMPLVIVAGMFGPRVRAILLLYNVGVEAAIWTVGVFVLTGHSVAESWRRLISPIFVALVLGVVVAQFGLGSQIPGPVSGTIHTLGVCAVPLGILLAGVNLASSIHSIRDTVELRTSLTSVVLRLGVFPAVWLAVARYAPLLPDLRSVLIVQAAMPTAMISIIAIKLYGGDSKIAARVLLGTTACSLLVTPLWIQAGLAWTGP